MKDYYEILEVSSNASSEVIEKAYKALVKKYHPDLQPDEKKHEAEDKIKVINEAYEVLSNEEKKKEYDIKLKKEKLKEDELRYANTKRNTQSNSNNARNSYNSNNYQKQNNASKSSMSKRVIRKPHDFGANDYNDFDSQNEFNQNINDIYRNAYNDAYNQAYINNLKNMGYQIHYEKTFGEKIRTFFAVALSIIFLLIICFILWHIPFIRNRLIDLYNSNDLIKLFADIVGNIINSFFSVFS